MSKCKQHNGNSGSVRPTTDCFYCWEAFITDHPKAHIGADDLLKVMQGFRKTIKEEALKDPPAAKKIREEAVLPLAVAKDEDVIEIITNQLKEHSIKINPSGDGF